MAEYQGCGFHFYNELCYLCRNKRDTILLAASMNKNKSIPASTVAVPQKKSNFVLKQKKQYVQTKLSKFFY